MKLFASSCMHYKRSLKFDQYFNDLSPFYYINTNIITYYGRSLKRI